jgi:hypothetical protein
LTSLTNTLLMEESKRLQSGELRGQISCDQWFFWLPFCRSWGILAVWAREAFTHLQEFDTLPGYFVTKKRFVFTLHHTRDSQLSNECRKQFL